MRIVTRAEMRAIDRWAIEAVGIPSAVLMENAGRGVAEAARRMHAAEGGGPGTAAVLCGPGNNGGDGFVAARHLANAGWRVDVILAGREGDFARSGDAASFLRVLRAMGVRAAPAAGAGEARERLAAADCVIDALFGTGLSRPPAGPAREAIDAVNAAARPARVLAVDIPSGLDADSGEPLGAAVRAAVTATMAFPKAGFFHAQGPAHCGEVTVVDIGIPARVPAWDGTRLIA